MLTKLSVTNFRNLDSLTLDPLGRVTLIAGKNGVGKTAVQVNQCGGFNNLRPFLKTFVALSEFDMVTSLAVVADADRNANGKRLSIADALESAGLPKPIRPLELVDRGGLGVAYLVVPHDLDGGMMEDVFLNSVANDPAMECVDRYLDCVSQVGAESPRQTWMPKARAHAFLASRDRPDLRLGEAAQLGVWDFDSDAFRPLENLIRIL